MFIYTHVYSKQDVYMYCSIVYHIISWYIFVYVNLVRYVGNPIGRFGLES